jgi:malonate-semialdehyde dehydrogenase (acetylating)/methylmalonate-semialdehyde dehydrogenase
VTCQRTGSASEFIPSLVEKTRALKVGCGSGEEVDIGPVISRESLTRILKILDASEKAGAKFVLDGRGISVAGYEKGKRAADGWGDWTVLDVLPFSLSVFLSLPPPLPPSPPPSLSLLPTPPTTTPGNFIGPTILSSVSEEMACYAEEIFGPVLCCVCVASLDEAIALVNRNSMGNGVALFTASGGAARKFEHEIEVGHIPT